MERAAAIAHLRFSAVMITRVPHILNASAKVSMISVDLIFIAVQRPCYVVEMTSCA